MTSQLNVDTIKGKSTAGSISIQGEGSKTTNLQQGLCKVRVQYDAPSTSNGEEITVGDSHNLTSIFDNGDGQVMMNFTNNMANVNYVLNVTATSQVFGALDTGTATTSQVRMETWGHGGSINNSAGMSAIFGDLA